MDMKEKTKEQIAVMQAFVEGKEIQQRLDDSEDWKTIFAPVWNWNKSEYRIKPEKLTVYIYRNKNTKELIPSKSNDLHTYIEALELIKTIELEV